MMPTVRSVRKPSWCDSKKVHLSFFGFKAFFNFVVSVLSGLKNLINEREESLNKTHIIKRLSENVFQNTNCSYNNYIVEIEIDFRKTVVLEQNNFTSLKRLLREFVTRIHRMIKKLFRKQIQSSGNSESNVHRNFNSGSRGNFKDNRRPAVVINNFPERQHKYQRKKLFQEKSIKMM